MWLLTEWLRKHQVRYARRAPNIGIRPRFESLECRRVLTSGVVISEFLARNDRLLRDGDGNSSDWIELQNVGDEAVDLAGWHLSDDSDVLDAWTFPTGQPELTLLRPGAQLLVFASGAEAAPGSAYIDPQGYLHANFRIRGAGESLTLSGPQGVISQIGTAEDFFPPQFVDISYGWAGDGLRYFSTPTPEAENPKTGYLSVETAPVTFSNVSQTFTEAFELTLSTNDSTGTIRYTLDGSPPSEESPEYHTPILVDGSVQVRARVVTPDFVAGPITSHSFVHLDASVADFTSPLPLLVLENFGQGPIPNKRGHKPPASDGGGIQQVPRQSVQLQFFDRAGETSSLKNLPDLSTRAGVRVRGSSSANFAKQSLTVETWGEQNDDQEIQPFEMPSESDWILYAPSREFDRTLLHNTFAFELSRQIGRYAVRFQFVEVFINTDGGSLNRDDHGGVYAFMEKVKRDPQRVDIQPLSADGTQGGWLLQSNRMQPVPVGGTEHPPNFHTRGPNRELQGPYGSTLTGGPDQGGDDIPTGYNTFLNFESPRGEEINNAQIDAIVKWFDEFETALYSDDFRDAELGYRAYIDVGSFIDHMLLTNLTLSFDALQLSTYMFRRSDGDKMELGPAWDFDRAYGADVRAAVPTRNLTYGRQFLWMPRLFEDPDYVQEYQDRWQELREGPFAIENLHAIIDRQAAEITPQVAAANGTASWSSRLEAMKSWLANRVVAIDELYPQKPLFDGSQFVAPGATVQLTSLAGTTYYTRDGTDPRLPGGQTADAVFEAVGGVAQKIELIGPDNLNAAIVPDAAFHSQYGMTWNGRDEVFDDSPAAGWQSGNGGVGFDERDTFLPFIGNDVQKQMMDRNTSVYIRHVFEVDELEEFDDMTLKVRYDDGFVAYLNGREIASANAPEELSWDSRADRVNRDAVAVRFEAFDVTSAITEIRPGRNVLAIHGMNRSTSSNDMLIDVQLEGRVFARTPILVAPSNELIARAFVNEVWSGPRRLVVVTPGDANFDGQFDSEDLAFVFAAGEYEDGVPQNSTFGEGDWNDDGDFTSEDLVWAFQFGAYVSSPAMPNISRAAEWDAPNAHRRDDATSSVSEVSVDTAVPRERMLEPQSVDRIFAV